MNNYNYNRDGISIDVNLYYSSDLTQSIFDENISLDNGIYIYTEYNQLSAYYEINKDVLIDDNKHNLIMIKRVLTRYCNYVLSDFNGDKIDVLINELFYNSSLLFSDDTTEFISLLNEYKITFIRGYLVVTSRGYSQGDIIDVYINKKEFKELTGVTLTIEKITSTINNILWDSIIGGEIKVEDDIFFIDDFLTDLTHYDRDEIISNLINTTNYNLTKEILTPLLPECLEYI